MHLFHSQTKKKKKNLKYTKNTKNFPRPQLPLLLPYQNQSDPMNNYTPNERAVPLPNMMNEMVNDSNG